MQSPTSMVEIPEPIHRFSNLGTMAAFGTTQRTLAAMLSRAAAKNRSFATSTTSKMKPFIPTADSVHGADHHPKPRNSLIKAEFAPVYVVMGMVVVAVAIGAHTAKQQLLHAPGVNISKKKRETVPEVEDPDRVVSSADKFLNKSFLRKVAHIQDTDPVLPDPVRADPFSRPREVDSLKSAGVDAGSR